MDDFIDEEEAAARTRSWSAALNRGVTTQIAENLARNTGGFYDSIVIGSATSEADDHDGQGASRGGSVADSLSVS